MQALVMMADSISMAEPVKPRTPAHIELNVSSSYKMAEDN